ncbi:MAG: D-aminoacyl-tRNA deacylase [Aigarchaeota archaeon]|nr:D-aminoacyl-tRNA deacylase [Candidatus Caldarchaeales archaeon]
MRKAVMLSLEDTAAVEILRILVENYGFAESGGKIFQKNGVPIICLDKSILYADDEVASLEADLVIVPSKHVSETGRRCLLVHSTGNWGASALYGGKPKQLSATSAAAVYKTLMELRQAVENSGLRDVEVGMEATHHGPYSEKPLIFVEVGSDIGAWRDTKMAEAAAEAVHNLCFGGETNLPEPAVGFGGGHYPRDILKPVFTGSYMVGHVASKHHFPLDEEVIRQAFQRTVEQPRTALIDWDGLRSEHRTTLTRILSNYGVDVVKV